MKLKTILTVSIFAILVSTPMAFAYSMPVAEGITLSKTVAFPTANDTWSITYYPYMWIKGDYIEGTRDLGKFAILWQMRIHLALENFLTGLGEVDIDVYLNGVKVGSFVVLPGDTAVDVTLSFLMFCKRGLVTIKYLETNTVASGCGSIIISHTDSTIKFVGLIFQ